MLSTSLRRGQKRPFRDIVGLALVALVLPFDAFEGAAKTIFAAFFCGLEAVMALGEVQVLTRPWQARMRTKRSKSHFQVAAPKRI